jgi:hypothetical protein
MSSLLVERYSAANEIISSTSEFDDSIASFIKEGLTEGLTRAVYEAIEMAARHTGDEGYKPEQQMMAMMLQSEFEWLFFDIDDHVDEDFMNETADVLPTIYDLICYYVLIISIVNKYE